MKSYLESMITKSEEFTDEDLVVLGLSRQELEESLIIDNREDRLEAEFNYLTLN